MQNSTLDLRDRRALASIARVREIGLEKSKLTKSCLDELIPDLRTSTARTNFKAQLVRDLIERAEAQYESKVRMLAMALMEHDRSLTSAEAMAHVDRMILEALLG